MRSAAVSMLAFSLALPLLAGGLALQILNPSGNAEAQAQHLVLLARPTACHAPEKTQITATAEGIVNGQRKTVPLEVAALGNGGTFGIARTWPTAGRWVIKVIATNPEYKNYSTGALVPFDNGSAQWSDAKTLFHAPGEAEVAALLTQPSSERAALP